MVTPLGQASRLLITESEESQRGQLLREQQQQQCGGIVSHLLHRGQAPTGPSQCLGIDGPVLRLLELLLHSSFIILRMESR